MARRILLLLIPSLLLLTAVYADTGALKLNGQYRYVEIQTNLGDIVVELDHVHAPITVTNFMAYVNSNAYDNTIFHRVIKDFMIQGGGFKSDFTKTPTRSAIVNEADNGLKNLRGTIAMARTREPDSATNQFFINTVDNDFLDHRSNSISGWGYAVFGRVVAGMDVVDKINALPTSRSGPFSGDVPVNTVLIYHVVTYQEHGTTDAGKKQPSPP